MTISSPRRVGLWRLSVGGCWPQSEPPHTPPPQFRTTNYLALRDARRLEPAFFHSVTDPREFWATYQIEQVRPLSEDAVAGQRSLVGVALSSFQSE
jgi:hypothetical protein